MKKQTWGILLGIVAGIIDVTPMVIMNLSLDACLSAFSMWIVVGFLISVMDFNINPFLKGIITAILVLFPTAILIAWKDPLSLIPIIIMTTILGSLLGFSIHRVNQAQK